MQWFDMTNIFVSIAALTASTISIILSLKFYIQTNDLNHEMNRTLVRIETLNRALYMDNVQILREMINRLFQREEFIFQQEYEELAEKIQQGIILELSSTLPGDLSTQVMENHLRMSEVIKPLMEEHEREFLNGLKNKMLSSLDSGSYQQE